MAFKLPSFGLLGRPTALKRISLFDNLPQFSWDDISDKEEIGRGSFGCVFTAKQRDGEPVVVKNLLRQHDRGANYIGILCFLKAIYNEIFYATNAIYI